LALQGNLEDLPLLDIIQIVSFSKKTGYLGVKMKEGEGAIVFHEGLVVAAFTPASPLADPRLAALPGPARETAIRRRLGFALEELARLREGAFGFELTDQVPASVAGRDIRAETLAAGINPQEMLLTLAQGMDDDRAQSTAAVEASFATPAEDIVAAELLALRPPVVPAEAVRSAFADEAEAPGADDTGPLGPDDTQAWQTTPAERYAPDTRPLPKVRREELRERAEPREPPAPAAPEPAPASAAAPPEPQAAPAEAARTILLVDDEPDVRQVLGRHFSASGYEVVEADGPEEAAKVAARLRHEQKAFVLVTDLGMPASGGASFQGGFEVMKRLWKMNLRPPVLMMTESLNQSLRLRARQMGVQSFVFKPTLSKIDARQFEADLQAFAAKLARDLIPHLAEVAALRPKSAPARKAEARPDPRDAARSESGPPPSSAARPFEFLKRRLVELREGGDANEIATLVMKVAREFFERSLLFVVKNEEARGLGGFGVAPRDETLNLLARQIAIPLGEASLFRDVARERRTFNGQPPADRWLGHMLGRIGRFQSRGIALLPLVAHRETIAMVFGDNPETGRDPGALEPLEVFVQQAGIALENVFLQKKLQAAEDKDRPSLR
jgi:CheY-like chemotaxis protein